MRLVSARLSVCQPAFSNPFIEGGFGDDFFADGIVVSGCLWCWLLLYYILRYYDDDDEEGEVERE